MTFHIESLGCAKNQVDSEQLIAALEARGLTWVGDPQAARLILVNTCGFITSAKEESIQTALSLKERYPQKKVIMIGCLVQRYGAELAREMREIDGFVGLDDMDELWSLISNEAAGAESAAGGAGPARFPRTRFLSYPGSAYVKVAEGCSNHCSYCAIPLIRGELVSRPVGQIVEEIGGLLDRGVVEIVLIAQDLASYGLDRGSRQLPELVRSILDLDGRFWLRLLYLHPDHFPEELLEIMAADPRVLPYFDLPFQHASPSVLQAMGRSGSAGAYKDLVGTIRMRIPEAVIRSTFLVGFPGESEEDLQALLDFQRECALDWVGVFAYSREEGTPAFALDRRVSKLEAKRRKAAVEQAQIPISRKRLDRQVGRILEVLVEEPVQGQKLFLGRAYLQAPEVDGLVVIAAEGLTPGCLVPVRIRGRAGIDLEADLA